MIPVVGGVRFHASRLLVAVAELLDPTVMRQDEPTFWWTNTTTAGQVVWSDFDPHED